MSGLHGDDRDSLDISHVLKFYLLLFLGSFAVHRSEISEKA